MKMMIKTRQIGRLVEKAMMKWRKKKRRKRRRRKRRKRKRRKKMKRLQRERAGDMLFAIGQESSVFLPEGKRGQCGPGLPAKSSMEGVARREAVKVADQEAGHTNVTDLCREMIQMIHY